jgi:hypothetical protein
VTTQEAPPNLVPICLALVATTFAALVTLVHENCSLWNYNSYITAFAFSVISIPYVTLATLVIERRFLSRALDRLERIFAIAVLAYFFTWIAYVALDEQICSARSLKEYAIILLLPSVLILLFGAGRRWLADDV